jgi:tetratricopeptide (TPR) repeat protein
MLRRLFERLAARSVRKTVDARDDPEPLATAARAALQQGNAVAAVSGFDAALARRPARPDWLALRAVATASMGRLDEAERDLRAAIHLSPREASYHCDLGNVLRMRGEPVAASAAYEVALAADPLFDAARINLASLWLDRDRPDLAEPLLRAVVLRDPRNEAALADLDFVWRRTRRHDAAREALLDLLVADPQNGPAHRMLGVLLRRHFGGGEPAAQHLARAHELGAGNADSHAEFGVVQQELGYMDAAFAAFDRASELDPGHVPARFQRAVCNLLAGRFGDAWDDYELRLESEDRPPRGFGLPRWDGTADREATVLVHAEQGIGDEIMFASCIDAVFERVGHVVIDCAPKLERIFRRSFPAATVHGGSPFDGTAWMASVPRCDFAIPTGSLPRLFRRDHADFPVRDRYLHADPGAVARWRERLAGLGPGAKVGISWRGGTPQSRSADRTIALPALGPLFAIEGIRFVSVQYDDTAEEVDAFGRASGRCVWRFPDLAGDDYDETAALVSALDAIVSVCTAVIHLGGALGRPVIVLAPQVPEWRYGISAEKMPWYSSVTVLRQLRRGDWQDPIERASVRLAALCGVPTGRPAR